MEAIQTCFSPLISPCGIVTHYKTSGPTFLFLIWWSFCWRSSADLHWAFHESATTSQLTTGLGLCLKLQVCLVWALIVGRAEVFPILRSSDQLGHVLIMAMAEKQEGSRNVKDVFMLKLGIDTLSLLPIISWPKQLM